MTNPEKLTAPKEHCRDAGVHPETRMRSFSLDSAEAYEALCPREEEPWIRNGSLPREPRGRDLPVVVERSGRGRR